MAGRREGGTSSRVHGGVQNGPVRLDHSVRLSAGCCRQMSGGIGPSRRGPSSFRGRVWNDVPQDRTARIRISSAYMGRAPMSRSWMVIPFPTSPLDSGECGLGMATLPSPPRVEDVVGCKAYLTHGIRWSTPTGSTYWVRGTRTAIPTRRKSATTIAYIPYRGVDSGVR